MAHALGRVRSEGQPVGRVGLAADFGDHNLFDTLLRQPIGAAQAGQRFAGGAPRRDGFVADVLGVGIGESGWLSAASAE
jgi:hypothetical protein